MNLKFKTGLIFMLIFAGFVSCSKPKHDPSLSMFNGEGSYVGTANGSTQESTALANQTNSSQETNSKMTRAKLAESKKEDLNEAANTKSDMTKDRSKKYEKSKKSTEIKVQKIENKLAKRTKK